MTMQASPAKLRNGEWGARVQGLVAAGDVVTITTRSGKNWEARVERVVWSGQGVSLCATQSMDRASHTTSSGRSGYGRGTWTGCSCGSVEEYERPGDCRSCRHDR